jgi:rod shape determining protein RodA
MKLEGLDKLGLGLYFLIVIFGIFNIYSVSPESGLKQATWLGISCFIGLIIFAIRTKFFENTAGIFYIISILLLIGLIPLGKEVNGQKNWYVMGPISLQPVEFVKIGVALLLSNFAAASDFNIKQKSSLIQVLIILGIPGFFILIQPDIGSLMVFMAFVITMYREGLTGWLFAAGALLAAIFLLSIAIDPIYIISVLGILVLLIMVFNIGYFKRHLAMSALVLLCFGLLGGLSYATPIVFSKLPKHHRERIEVLYKGEKAFRDTAGYNLLYSKTAIGSGGILGKGFKEGSITQGKFVPEQRTDYIFCTVGEEWGFVGSSFLVIAFALYIGRIYYLAENMKSSFNRVFGYCFASIILMHFCINIGMVMGLFPTVGIPLPYFSYGGSSLLAFSTITFIFFKLNYTDVNSLV